MGRADRDADAVEPHLAGAVPTDGGEEIELFEVCSVPRGGRHDGSPGFLLLLIQALRRPVAPEAVQRAGREAAREQGSAGHRSEPCDKEGLGEWLVGDCAAAHGAVGHVYRLGDDRVRD